MDFVKKKTASIIADALGKLGAPDMPTEAEIMKTANPCRPEE